MIRSSDSNRRFRPAFTLIELLVVIAIIGVLISLSAAAFFRTLSVKKGKNTQQLIQKLYTQLQRQMKAVIDDARTESISSKTTVMTLAGNDPNRARIIWIKLRLKQQFPMSYAEALNPGGGVIPQSELAPEPAYGKILAGKGSALNPATESAACLLMALTARNRRGVDQVKDFLSAAEMADTDGDGVQELVDGWGNPLAFFRWPTPPSNAPSTPNDPNYVMLMSPLSSSGNGWNPNPSATFQDPQDPTGTLQAPAWKSSSSGTSYQSLCHTLDQVNFNQYLIPVIASAGPDGKLALTATFATVPPLPNSATLDNLYSDPSKLGP